VLGFGPSKKAVVAELVDAPDSGSGTRKGVEVQVFSTALILDSYAALYGGLRL
jgi:hypothetical protein